MKGRKGMKEEGMVGAERGDERRREEREGSGGRRQES
jgi:hypothetical protein